jgi:hypothetical protein
MNFLETLGILFIGLKLTGYIDWPWYLVVSPVVGVILLHILNIALDEKNR